MVGVVAPCGMTTDDVTVSLLVSLLISVIVSPPTGAGEERVTAMGALWPGATTTLDARAIAPNCETRMLEVPLV